jgi:hypothetical protein
VKLSLLPALSASRHSFLRSWLLASSYAGVLCIGQALGACAGNTAPPGRPPGDGGSADMSVDMSNADMSVDMGNGDGGVPCVNDVDCPDDGIFCNGRLVCMGGRCRATDIPSCNDGIACTRDECLASTDACANTPVNAACPVGLVCIPGTGCAEPPSCEFDTDCDDGMVCNGVESCVGGRCMGAAAGPDCSAEERPAPNNCTTDECVEARGGCVHTLADHLRDPMRCGPTGANDCVVCPMPAPGAPNVSAACRLGVCTFECADGWVDTDGNLANGCECRVTADTDEPDDTFTDANCDGVDGDVTRAVFVSTRGADRNDGLTRTTPVRSIGRAFEVASSSGRTQILVANGAYGTSTPLALPDGRGLYGGYSDDFRTRTNSRANLVSSARTAIEVRGHTMPSVIDRVDLSTEDQTGPQAWTATLVVTGSGENFRLRYATVVAGRGGNGGNGAPGTTPPPGTMGSPGSGASGGAGGAVGGGRGGDGRYRGTGMPGQMGAANGSPCGGTGGVPNNGGRGCGDGDPQAGGDGGHGCEGRAGDPGAGGTGAGSVAGGLWIPTHNGAPGVAGGTGGAGGGGAAGGGEDCTVLGTCVYCGTGRGGGGGGGGGAGGTGGEGGQGGGASIAILLETSLLEVENVSIRTGGGGNGGQGGGGGEGAPGGIGGAGAASSSSTEGAGGRGGNGGRGGRGGCGGGGAGGPSVGIFGGAAAQVRAIGTVSYMIGPAGAPGLSCAGGNAGAAGVSAERQNVSLL